MSRPRDGRKISIDEAVETVITEATVAAVRNSCAELKEQLDSATSEAGDAAQALKSATKGAQKAVEGGKSAILKLNQLVWAVALMPVLSAIADPIATLFQGSNVDPVPTIARVTGALIPLAGLFVVRRWNKTKERSGRETPDAVSQGC